jgi:fumarylacetoacetase
MSFVPYDATCHFPLQNLPYGVFSVKGQSRKRLCVAIGDQVLDLAEVAKGGIFSQAIASALQEVASLIVLGEPCKHTFTSQGWRHCLHAGNRKERPCIYLHATSFPAGEPQCLHGPWEASMAGSSGAAH